MPGQSDFDFSLIIVDKLRRKETSEMRYVSEYVRRIAKYNYINQS